MRTTSLSHRVLLVLLVLTMLFCFRDNGLLIKIVYAQSVDPSPPQEIVKLIFIHHSCGENWLTDGNGNLGIALGENNYFVSDTNYGWGPDSIGDNTDIINWPDWFRGSESPRYLSALYNESGQNSNYTRRLPDPGGENQIVMFKSCFPNSNLSGQPDDPPTPGLDFTVGNAKYIYNDLLNYFSSRPDKLFIVITAPPVQDSTYAYNARAFNTWLVQDWLQENNYPLDNVAVWDFHAVLTHPENHHRFNNGAIEYIYNQGDGTSTYPTSSDDDHPNPTGNRKATEEFVPLLNVFYNRWKSGAPVQLPMQSIATVAEMTQAPTVEERPAIATDLIDDFEFGIPVVSQGWQAYSDEGSQTSIKCSPESGVVYSGSSALHINFSIAPASWATCALIYDQNQDWRSAVGLSFYIRANKSGLPFDIITYGGSPEALEGYMSTQVTSREMVDGWVYMEFSWDMLKRPDWESNAGAPFEPTRVAGMAIGIGAFPDTNNQGEIWIDEVRLIGAASLEPTVISQLSEPLPTEPGAPPQAEPVLTPTNTTVGENGNGGICPLSPALGVMAGAFVFWANRKRKNNSMYAIFNSGRREQ